MQKLTLKRKASGLHSALTPDGECVGIVDLDDLDLNDDEFAQMVRHHAEKNRSKSAAEELIRQANAYAKKAGKSFSEALAEVSRENLGLSEAHRRQVMGSRERW